MIVILKMLSTFLTTRIIINLAKVCGYGPSDKVNPPEGNSGGFFCAAPFIRLYPAIFWRLAALTLICVR